MMPPPPPPATAVPPGAASEAPAPTGRAHFDKLYIVRAVIWFCSLLVFSITGT